jgi:hypothetical protein
MGVISASPNPNLLAGELRNMAGSSSWVGGARGEVKKEVAAAWSTSR